MFGAGNCYFERIHCFCVWAVHGIIKCTCHLRFVYSFESICSSILLLGEHRCYDIVVMLYKICESFGLPLPYGNFLWTLFVRTLNFT